MFGYIQANVKELKIREYEQYRAYYCGLCHELKKRYGRRGQFLLSYDMTFLLMLLIALYEPEETRTKSRCIPHPLKRHEQIRNEITSYAADMTILLSYRKAADDWQDERSVKGRLLRDLLERDNRKTAAGYPRQAGELGRCVKELLAAEKSGSRDPDYISGLTGAFLGEMFVWKKDMWEEQLRKTGFYLGKFIYLMDAWDDREEDQKRGNYNIFNVLGTEEDTALAMMQDTMAHCCRAFEQLPIVEMAPILRNILYAGVWTAFASGQERSGVPDRSLQEEE